MAGLFEDLRRNTILPVGGACLAAICLFAVATGRAEAADMSVRGLVVDNHIKYIPPGDGPFQTLIAIPGCSGISSDDPALDEANPGLREDDLLFRRHYRNMGAKFQDAGFAVLLINIHDAEDVVTACGGEIQGERIAAYINESIGWATTLSFVDPEKIHVIGWSMGGWGALTWLHGPRSEAGSVRSVITVYPDCRGRDPLTISKPLLMLLGDADDIAVPSVCKELIETSSNRGAITLRRYPNARHGFDIPEAPPFLDIGNGMSVGYEKDATEKSWREMMNFLATDL